MRELGFSDHQMRTPYGSRVAGKDRADSVRITELSSRRRASYRLRRMLISYASP